MLDFLAILYGLFISFLVYFMSYMAGRGIMGCGAIPFVLVIGKYLIYWQVIVFGFKHLPTWGILVGLTGGIYLSLPILYWYNKKMNPKKE